MQAAPPPVKKPSLRTAEPQPATNASVAQGAISFFSFAWWSNRVRRSSAFLSSALVHALMLLALAWFVYVDPHGGRQPFVISSQPSVQEELDKLVVTDITPSKPTPPNDTEAATEPASLQSTTLETEETNATSESMPALSIVSETAPPTLVRLDPFSAGQLAMLPVAPPFAKSSVEGRSLEKRAQLALAKGGTAASEQAVEAALKWLVAHQHKDGGWSMVLFDPTGQGLSPCSGQCSHGSHEMLDGKRYAATGLALLTFLGAGYTHHEGKYRDQVYRGLAFLMDHLQIDPPDGKTSMRWQGQFASPTSRHQIYEQGIATLALCEAYQMTHDKILEKSCQAAVQFVVRSQNYDGSWGYFPRTPGDLSIVGWQLMSLKSAYAGELMIDPRGIRRVNGFLDSRQLDGGIRYAYRQGGRGTPSITSIAILMRLYLGVPRSDQRLQASGTYVAENGPSPSNVYYNYYAGQSLFQLNHPLWPKWNAQLRDYLVAQQSRQGHEAGSWYFEDEDHAGPSFNSLGGRLYCTTLSAMALEVYYRYMPIYLDTSEKPFNF